jgi:hypothetical protein
VRIILTKGVRKSVPKLYQQISMATKNMMGREFCSGLSATLLEKTGEGEGETCA